jgi:hypothetical protein
MQLDLSTYQFCLLVFVQMIGALTIGRYLGYFVAWCWFDLAGSLIAHRQYKKGKQNVYIKKEL